MLLRWPQIEKLKILIQNFDYSVFHALISLQFLLEAGDLVDEGGIVEHPQHEALPILPVTAQNKLGTRHTLVEGLTVEDGSFEVAEVPPQMVRQFPEISILQFILILAGRGVMLEGVVQQRDKKFRSVCRRNEGKARFGDRAHLVKSSILHGVLRRDDIVTKITTQPFPVLLYIV